METLEKGVNKTVRKVSVSGKGGTGKSVISTLLAKVLTEIGYSVVVIDSDESNPGLYRMLGVNKAPKPLYDLFGGRQQVERVADEVSLSGGARAEAIDKILKLFRLGDKISIEDIPSEYFAEKNNLKLLATGKITESYEGCACPIGIISKAFLDKLFLKENELAVVDMEAGVEHFGRGIDNAIDTLLIVVEPSFESVSLAGKINMLGRSCQIKEVWCLLNKIPSDSIENELQMELEKRKCEIIGAIPYDIELSEACLKGRSLGESQAKKVMHRIALSILGKPGSDRTTKELIRRV
jgi:CO dehydrogenase maturation factor